MAGDKRRQLESTIAAIQQRYGPNALQRARDLRDAARIVPHVATGFPTLDALTGCGGVPLGDLTLLSGSGTSGKRTIAYKTLANAQSGGRSTALLDLARTANPDYLQRCGIALDRLLIARPQSAEDALPVLLDLVQSRRVPLLLVDGAPELMETRAGAQRFGASLAMLRQLARTAQCAVLLLHETPPAWQQWLGVGPGAALRQNVALHLELRREQWLRADGALVGYEARAYLLYSRWRSDRPSAPVEIIFNGTIHARSTW